jgi:hypothetical protein
MGVLLLVCNGSYGAHAGCCSFGIPAVACGAIFYAVLAARVCLRLLGTGAGAGTAAIATASCLWTTTATSIPTCCITHTTKARHSCHRHQHHFIESNRSHKQAPSCPEGAC